MQTKMTSESHLPLNKLLHRCKEDDTFKRTKSNSTSTLYLNGTVLTPDVDQLLHCVAKKLFDIILKGHQSKSESSVYFDIFDERIHPMETSNPTLPTVDNIYVLIDVIFTEERLAPECAIMMLCYIDRIVELTKVNVDETNWRRIILSTLILASKVWEDQAVWNIDFQSVFPNITVIDLAKLEQVVLNLLKFNVSLKASLYAKYYFALRELCTSDNFPLKPLDKEGAHRLESRSETEEIKAKKMYGHVHTPRSKSMDFEDGIRSPRAVLN